MPIGFPLIIDSSSFNHSVKLSVVHYVSYVMYRRDWFHFVCCRPNRNIAYLLPIVFFYCSITFIVNSMMTLYTYSNQCSHNPVEFQVVAEFNYFILFFNLRKWQTILKSSIQQSPFPPHPTTSQPPTNTAPATHTSDCWHCQKTPTKKTKENKELKEEKNCKKS